MRVSMTNRPNRAAPSQFVIEDELDEMFGRGNPNPRRIGCPPRDVLIALARRERPISDPLYEHLGNCSPCYREGRALQQHRSAEGSASRLYAKWIAAAAVVILLAAAGVWLYLRPQGHAP